jgi:hypothetical protein
MRNVGRRSVRVPGCFLVLGAICGTANAAVTLLGIQYQPDRAFPEHQCFWSEKTYPTSCNTPYLGANVHLYLRNSGSSTVTVSDVTLAGLSLKTCLKERIDADKRHAYSIYFASLSSEQLQTLINAGEPVWYKTDPASIPPGGVAQVVLRLRYTPVTPTISIGVVSSGGTVSVVVPVTADVPAVAGVSFSWDLTKAYIYWRRTGGAGPTTILMDGADVTANTTTVSDPSVGLVASVLQPTQPFSPMSYHVFQGVYADGKTATASLRAWMNPFIYGTWGGQSVADGDNEAASASLIDFTNHGMNALVMNGSAVTSVLMKSPSGRQFVADHGYGFVIDEIGKWACDNPLMWFIRDEPDCADSRVSNLPAGGGHNVGVLAMSGIERGEELRAANPLTPTTVNIDGTYKPYNYYNYGQLPDVFMQDLYYQARMREAYWTYPNRIPLYQKATYIYASTQVASSACEPNPLHVILYSCQWKDSSGAIFPFPTPASKRIEVYYALAGGAKGLAYWWYPNGNPSSGLAADTPAARALFKEMGVLGAEIKTAAPLLVTSCPATMAVQGSPGVWVRSLLVGADTIVLLAVNDQYLNDEAGTHYTPVAGASLTATLPAWLPSPSAFEIAAGGIHDVATQVNASQLQVNLGTLDLTRMIVLTSNPQLRATIEQRYEQEVRPGVCTIAPEVCAEGGPPVVTQQPQSGTICAGAAATFSVAAAGSGALTYQWQKDQADLGDGGQYAGVATATLTVSNASTADAGSYRCVVSNAYGNVNSNEAALTVIACNPACLQNLGFEGGFTGGAGNGWTKFIKAGSEGTNLSFSDETTEKHGGSHCQEIYSHDVNNDGGVYQRFAVTAGQPYTVKTWFKVYSPQGTGIAEGFLGIDPYGGTDPNSATVQWLSKPYEYWSQKPWTGTAQADSITVYLRGRSTKTPDKNKTAYVWIDDIEVAPGAPTDVGPQALSESSIRWRWTDLAIETGYRVRDGAGADVSGLLPADTTQWLETAGILPNTQYTRRIHAINDCGESDPSVGQTAYSLVETPTDVAVASVDTTSVTVSPVGTFSNLAVGSSGLLVLNTTAGTDSGWQRSETPWTSSGLAPNTAYDFVARARNGDGIETPDCAAETTWTLSLPPGEGSVTPGTSSPGVGEGVIWTAAAGFGAGSVEYYRYAWDQAPTHVWTGEEPRWSSGTITTSPASAGTWYLHVQSCNGDDTANGSYDYAVSTTGMPAADLDHDGDVDLSDFTIFQYCFNGPNRPLPGPSCTPADFDTDADVDLADFSAFQSCFNGPNRPPACPQARLPSSSKSGSQSVEMESNGPR